MIVWYGIAAVFLYVFPGWALISIAFKDRFLYFYEKLGISAGISIAIYPLLILWFRVIRFPMGFWACLSPGAIGLLVLAWRHRKKLRLPSEWRDHSKGADSWFRILNLIILVTIFLIFLTRFSAIRDMIAPSWGDSVHHTLIVQLLLDNGGLFDSWQPYAPMESMTYHFGFHAASAAWAWLTGFSAAESVLIVGQIFNGLAVLVLFSLVCRLSGSRWAGLAALIVAGFIFPFPGYFLNWGRYTQLTGQIILPVLILLFDSIWSREENPKTGTYAITAVLFSGLILSHYRVALLAAVAALTWGIWGLWQMRKKLSVWIGRALSLGGSAIATSLLVFPWLLPFRQSQVFHLYTEEKAFQRAYDLWVWKNTSFYFSDWFLILGGLAVILAFILRPRLALPLTGWCLLSFFNANSFFLGIQGLNWTNNTVLLFAIYIPLGIFLGWLAGWTMEETVKTRWGIMLSMFLVLFFLGWGAMKQIRIADPFFQMVTPSDKAAFDWIVKEIPEDAMFLVNGFQPPSFTIVVGSDAGWWLPYYTRRSSKILPALYSAERVDSTVDVNSVRQLVADIRASSGDQAALRSILCRFGISHIFLGQKRGVVGYGAHELIPEDWLSENPDFTLVYQKDKAQVWSFVYKD
jgi:hypothetical protein